MHSLVNLGNCITTTKTHIENISLTLKGLISLNTSHRKPLMCCHFTFAFFRILYKWDQITYSL